MDNLSMLLFGTGEIVVVSIFGALFLSWIVYCCFVPVKSWFNLIFSGCYIPSWKLISLKMNKFDIKAVVNAYIMAKKAHVKFNLTDIQSVILNGGNAENVIKALALTKDADIPFTKELANAIEFATGNVYEKVQESVNTKLIRIDDIKGFTQDDYEMIVSAEVSLKLNLSKYLNNLGEEDVKSVVFAWLMENISKTKNHESIVREPNKTLLSNMDLRVIGKNSMYNVMNINIVSVNIGRNLNAEKDVQMAEKEKVYAQIEAERMKNVEEIKELQMRTKTEQMKSQVLQAEAEIPMAISQAIKEGRFSVMDYYKLMNLQADTAMRRAIIDSKNNNNSDDDEEGDLF